MHKQASAFRRTYSGAAAIVAALSMSLAAAPATAAPIHDAASSGDIQSLARLLREGADINAPNATGETPLMVAALAGKTGMVQVLISRGADLAARNDRGMTALHAAAYAGDARAAALLISAGAPVEDALNKFAVTPLIVAAEENRPEVVELLLSKGADIEHRERHGYTALTRAGFKGRAEIVTLLLEHHASCQNLDPIWFADCEAKQSALGI